MRRRRPSAARSDVGQSSTERQLRRGTSILAIVIPLGPPVLVDDAVVVLEGGLLLAAAVVSRGRGRRLVAEEQANKLVRPRAVLEDELGGEVPEQVHVHL